MGPVETLVHVDAFRFGYLTELDRFKFFTNPVANFTVLNMHELHSNLTAISFLVSLNQLAQDPLILSLDNSATERHLNVELAVHVSLCEAVGCWVEHLDEVLVGEAELLGEARTVTVDFLELKGVDIGQQVTVGHVGAKQHL